MTADLSAGSISVHATVIRYAPAAAELSRSARLSNAVSGSVVVLPGSRGWGASVERAHAAGAIAVVVDAPSIADSDRDVHLVVELSGAIPIVLARPRLRPDVAADARRDGGSSTLISVECASAASSYGEVLCDAVGWARTLAGAELTLSRNGGAAGSSTALLSSDAHSGSPAVAVTLLAARRDSGAPWLRARTVDANRIEVIVEGPRHVAAVEISGSAGRLRQSTRYESLERLALRRAVDALEQGARPSDAAELLHDARITARVRGVPL